jgi:hypothetical protein
MEADDMTKHNAKTIHSSTKTVTIHAIVSLGVILFTHFGTAQTWSSAGPVPRDSHSAVLDTTTNRMIVFGGNSVTANSASNRNLNDVWRLGPGLGWASVKPIGTPPSARLSHSAVYDPASNRMIIFAGGLGHTSPCENDVWVLTNANGNGGIPEWIQLNPSGSAPAARLRHSAVYDSNTNTMIVFGGNDCFSTIFGDVWLLSNANGVGGTPVWTQLSTSGASPGTSQDHTAVYDPSSNRMIVFGGGLGGSNSNEVWVLENANGTGGTPTWTQLSPSGTPPAGREEHSAVYDPSHNLMTVFGGNNSTSVLRDTWVLSNANGLGGTPTWKQLGPFNVFAEARTVHAAVYNPKTNKMTVFGGALTNALDTNDVWVLSHANGQ